MSCSGTSWKVWAQIEHLVNRHLVCATTYIRLQAKWIAHSSEFHAHKIFIMIKMMMIRLCLVKLYCEHSKRINNKYTKHKLWKCFWKCNVSSCCRKTGYSSRPILGFIKALLCDSFDLIIQMHLFKLQTLIYSESKSLIPILKWRSISLCPVIPFFHAGAHKAALSNEL